MVSSTEQPAEVAAYLRQLDGELVDVPTAIAGDIRRGVSESLTNVSAEEARRRIAQLGDPAFIAAEARAGVDAPRARTGSEARGYVIAASTAFAVGGFLIPLVGWIVGCVLVCRSAAWRTGEKVVAVAVPLSLALLVAGFVAVSELANRTTPGGPVDQPLLPVPYNVVWSSAIVFALANLIVGIWLLVRALRRPNDAS